MFLSRLNGLPGLVLAGVLVCEAIGFIPESFANPRNLFPPFLNVPLEENEEIQEELIASSPGPSFGKGKGSGLLIQSMFPAPVVADLYFDEGRSFIQGGMEALLRETVVLLKREKQWRLRIEGHCDSRGTFAYNLARADYHLLNLTIFLQIMGIQAEQIHLLNFGQDSLACQENGEGCQEDNLRAERIFSILAVEPTQRGCVARLRLVAGKDWERALRYSRRSPYLQRIQVASPHFSSF